MNKVPSLDLLLTNRGVVSAFCRGWTGDRGFRNRVTVWTSAGAWAFNWRVDLSLFLPIGKWKMFVEIE